MVNLKKSTDINLSVLINKVRSIRDAAISTELQYSARIDSLHEYHKNSARNLLHYLAMRTFDLGSLQEQLSTLGISSIGHSERYTLVNLNNILYLLRLLNKDNTGDKKELFSMDYPKSKKRLQLHTEELFGVRPSDSRTRIMVTMPSEAANNKRMIEKMLDTGMNCARINCSHDTREDWKKMIKNIRKLSKKKAIPCLIYMDIPGPKLRTGPIQKSIISSKKKKKKNKERGLLLKLNDLLKVYKKEINGHDAVVNKKGKIKQTASISTTIPAIFNDIKKGESIWFDDGKIGGEIIEVYADHFEVKITQAGKKGSILRASKGINLPDTDLSIPSLTKKDLKDLPFMVNHADMIGYSFVRKAEDVALLQKKLKKLDKEDIGIILKIETWDAFQNLPAILLQAMESPKIGVMIARGDLAVEIGWERISEIQEEILWLCEAAHIPTVWATQILETLAKKGLATRSEITDAAMAARAECAMLNKGPFIIKALKTLSRITSRMKAHQRKKMGTLRPLSVAEGFLSH